MQMHAPGQSSPSRRPTPPGGERTQPPGDAAVGASPDPDLARSIWESMSAFVLGNDPADELRRALRLGRGRGRVKALISLADGPLSLAELARRIGADPPYATVIVNELEALGLLSRSPDDRDRRRKAVELTQDGREAVRKAQDIIARPPAPLRDMPAADLARLSELLGYLSPQRDAGARPAAL
jgi:DNA-binding MarR family transcriptional regulator